MIEQLSKRIREVSGDRVPCVLLGVRSVIEWQDDGATWFDNCGDECFAYLQNLGIFSVNPCFRVLPGESLVRKLPFGGIDAIWYGDNRAETILREVCNYAITPFDLYDPFAADDRLVPGVEYSHAALRKRCGLGADNNADERDEVVEWCVEDWEANLERLIRRTRRCDVFGKLTRTTGAVPAFKELTDWGKGLPLTWIFEAVIHDLAASVEAILQREARERADSGQKYVGSDGKQLTKTNLRYVFCGIVWHDYRQSQISKGEKPLIKDSFFVAKGYGWPDNDQEKFGKWAKEGVKPGKPWTELVQGEKQLDRGKLKELLRDT